MLNKKSIGVALACALALGAWSGSVLATPTNVGGVIIDPSSPLDLQIQAINFRESTIKKVGDTLYGYGVIGSLNGTNQSVFCPNCDINFTFQYTVKSIDTTGLNPKVVFDMGSLNFYVDSTSSYNVLKPTTAGIGSLWLSLSGHTAPYTGFSTVGQLYSTVVGPVSNPTNGSSGFGLLDVTGGLAAYFTNTNTIADGNGGFADFSLDSSFQNQPGKGCKVTSPNPANFCHYPISGTGQLLGASKMAVPEPGPAGLLGVGLAVLGLLVRRRRTEAEGRA